MANHETIVVTETDPYIGEFVRACNERPSAVKRSGQPGLLRSKTDRVRFARTRNYLLDRLYWSSAELLVEKQSEMSPSELAMRSMTLNQYVPGHMLTGRKPNIALLMNQLGTLAPGVPLLGHDDERRRLVGVVQSLPDVRVEIPRSSVLVTNAIFNLQTAPDSQTGEIVAIRINELQHKHTAIGAAAIQAYGDSIRFSQASVHLSGGEILQAEDDFAQLSELGVVLDSTNILRQDSNRLSYLRHEAELAAQLDQCGTLYA